MTQNSKYMGMSLTQIGILAGLTILVCLLFGVFGWLALKGGLKQFAAPQITLTPSSTPTPFAIPTIAPTGTPTAIPYESLIPGGWAQFKTPLVEIWLPAEFQLGTPGQVTGSSSLAVPELLVTGPKAKSSSYQMLVMVSYEPLTSDSLDTFLDGKIAKFPADVHVAERRKVSINSSETIRFVFEARKGNLDVENLAYVFLDGTTVWYVEYVAGINEFFEKLSTFEDSVKTFRVVK